MTMTAILRPGVSGPGQITMYRRDTLGIGLSTTTTFLPVRHRRHRRRRRSCGSAGMLVETLLARRTYEAAEIRHRKSPEINKHLAASLAVRLLDTMISIREMHPWIDR